MAIINSDSVGERGKKDARRHREKQKETIKEHLPEIISEEAIITSKGKRIVKIPIRGIEIPTFRPAQNGEESYGIGQGNGDGDGVAGDKPGIDYIETEVEIEELIEMMLEDLGLPNLTLKQAKQILVDLGFKISGKSRSGPWPLLNSAATAKEGIKRFWGYLRYLQKETGKDELFCFDALKRSNGILKDALEMLKDSQFQPQAKIVEPFPVFENEDLRFHKIKKKEKLESQAVIIAMMDVSGSMDIDKKYLARSMLFWLATFLRNIYERVEIRFIIHHTEAKLVDEQTFFSTGESGGTFCYSAYELAGNLIDTEYPTSQWNVYLFHFSDGDDFDSKRSAEELKKCLNRGINMFGYGQISPGTQFEKLFGKSEGNLLGEFAKRLQLTQVNNRGLQTFVGKDDCPFVGVLIADKAQIWPAIQEYLKKGRWENART